MPEKKVDKSGPILPRRAGEGPRQKISLSASNEMDSWLSKGHELNFKVNHNAQLMVGTHNRKDPLPLKGKKEKNSAQLGFRQENDRDKSFSNAKRPDRRANYHTRLKQNFRKFSTVNMKIKTLKEARKGGQKEPEQYFDYYGYGQSRPDKKSGLQRPLLGKPKKINIYTDRIVIMKKSGSQQKSLKNS